MLDPETGLLQGHDILQRTPRVVLSLSSPLPTEVEDFEEESDGCVWRKLAAFVETTGGTSSSLFDDEEYNNDTWLNCHILVRK